MAACDLPVFVDGDDGYGDVKNVVHTVQTYERMGVSAILIEDQQWPKRCGHMVGKKVVPTELAVAKIKAACSERINPETWILARTDARAVCDLDTARAELASRFQEFRTQLLAFQQKKEAFERQKQNPQADPHVGELQNALHECERVIAEAVAHNR